MAIKNQSSRLGTAENLPSGSTYDLLLVSTSDSYPVGQVSFKLENTPRKITGIQKVAQLFMKVLFTQKGSDVLNYNLGTNFPELAIGANRTSEDALFLSSIASEIKDAESQVRNITASNLGDLASQLAKISILGMSTDRDSLSMYVQITTVAGESASIAVPFPQLDMQLANG